MRHTCENGLNSTFSGCVNFITNVYKCLNIMCIILFKNTIYCVFVQKDYCNFQIGVV